MTSPKIAVIGGGISGLATAYYLLKLSKQSGVPLDVTLFEGGSRLGGVIDTEKVDGFILEKGPDAFITDKPWALSLAKELGLENEIISTNASNRRSFIARRGKLLPVPEGFYLVAPLQAASFLRSSIVSWSGKLRMMAEIFIPKKKDEEDESVASFVRRRFGSEALERVAQAMIGGIYTGDPERLSLRATMPRFFELEQKQGSLTRGLLGEAANKKASTAASGPRYSLFASFRGGMNVLAGALAHTISETCIQRGFLAREVRCHAANGKWEVDFGEKGSRYFDAVCITTSATHAATLLKQELPEVSNKLSSIVYESVATVNLAYKAEQIAHPLNGFGFVVPKTENKAVIACSFSSRKFEGRCPEGHVLLRAFVGGAFGRHHLKKNGEDLLRLVENELKEYLRIQGDPVLARLERYPGAMVQYSVGHLDIVSEIRKEIKEVKGLFLTGASYGGAGIPDCVKAAQDAARQIFDTRTTFNQEK